MPTRRSWRPTPRAEWTCSRYRDLSHPCGPRSGGASCAHVIGAGAPEDGGRVVVAAVGLHGHDRTAGLELAVIVIRLVLGDAAADEGPGEARNTGAGRGIRQDHAEGPARDGRADHRDHSGQHAEPRQGTQAHARQRACQRSGTGLRIVGRSAGSHLRPVGMTHRDADLVIAEAGRPEIRDCAIGMVSILEDSNDGGTLLHGHEILLAWIQGESRLSLERAGLRVLSES